MTIEMIEASRGRCDGGWWSSSTEELRTKTYRPQAVRTRLHPQGQWEVEAVGHPDPARPESSRQQALANPGADLRGGLPEDCSYGFRPGRSAHQALEEIRGHIQAGYQAVYDADLKGYFDSIPHDKLIACLRMRDGRTEQS